MLREWKKGYDVAIGYRNILNPNNLISCSSGFMFILLILRTSLSSFILIKETLFNKQIEELTKELLKNNNISLKENLFQEQFSSYGIPEGVIDYIDEEETNEYVTNFFEQYIKSLLGQGNIPTMNNENLKKIVDNAIIEYEKDNNVKIDSTEFYKAIDEYDKSIKNQNNNTNIDNRIVKVFNLIYDKNTITYLIIGIIICLVLLYLLNRNFISVLKHISTTLMINGIGLAVISYIVSNINFQGKVELSSLIKYVTSNINKVAYSSIILSILIIIGTFIYTKRKKEETL